MKTCFLLFLALWVGGLTFFVGVGRAPVGRWSSVWALAASGTLLLLFRGRHFEPRSLVLELPVALASLLTLYSACILQPEIWEARARMRQPEFQGTTHLEKLRFSFNRLHDFSMRLYGVILFLGWFALCLAARFLR